MKEKVRTITKKTMAITVAVMMVVTCFAVINADYSYAAKKKKVISVTLTNVGDVYTIKKGTSMKLKYSVQATKKKYKKVKWKSSNKKVVTVTRKGKIKAKKNGTAYITVYSKTNKKKKDRVKIIVATPVSSVMIDGSWAYVKKGGTKSLSVSVKPSNASNKKLTWTSSNNAVATVSQSGVVTAKKEGTTFVKAIAKDGTGRYGWINVKVIQLHRDDAVFIAHRGYSAIAPQNTLPAFELASRYNFHGAEMDIWESYKYQKEIPNPDYVPQEDNEPEPTVESPAEDGTEPSAEDGTEQPVEEGTEPSDENEDNPPEEIPPTITVEDFDLNVMHNSTTGAMCGKNVSIKSVNDTNREQYPITKGNGVSQYSRLYIPKLDDVLRTLYETNQATGHETLPVIELKQESYSSAAIERVLDLVETYGGKATIISFNVTALSQAQAEIEKREAAGTIAAGDVQTQYLVTGNSKSYVDKCVSKHFDGISIKYTAMTTSIVNYAHSKGLIVAAWTMPSMAEAARMIDMGVDKVTSDYKLFVDN